MDILQANPLTPEQIKYLVAPVICALIGWFTNYLAVKMLFHPRKPVRILFVTIQGIFPKRQSTLALNLGTMIEKELLSGSEVADVLRTPDFADKFKDLADPYVETFLREKLVSLHPMVGMFLNEEMIAKVKVMLSDQLAKMLPDLMDRAAGELEDSLQLGAMVRDKIEAFSMDKLEEILFAVLKSEFKFIELAGAVLGFLIGCVQSAAFYYF